MVALRRRTRTDLILASFVLVYFADLLTIRAHFDRYMLPLVPALGALAGRLRSLAPVTLACCSSRSSGRSATTSG